MTRPTPEALLEASRHLRQTGTLDERGHLLLAAALGLLASGSFVGASHRIDELVAHVNDGGLDPFPACALPPHEVVRPSVESASHRDAVAGRIARLGLSPSEREAVWREVTLHVARNAVTLTRALDVVLARRRIAEDDVTPDAPRDGIDR